MKKLLLLVFLASNLGAFSQSAEEQSVWSSVEALTKAVFETKDSVAINGLANKYVTYAHSSGLVEDRPTMIRAAVSSALKYKNLSIEKGEINIDGNTAVLRHNLRGVSVDAGGTESPLNLGILQVWKKNNGKWQIWARQAVRIPAKTN